MPLTAKQMKWKRTVHEVLARHKRNKTKVSLKAVLKEASKEYKTQKGGFIAAGSRLTPSNYAETAVNYNKNANESEINKLVNLL